MRAPQTIKRIMLAVIGLASTASGMPSPAAAAEQKGVIGVSAFVVESCLMQTGSAVALTKCSPGVTPKISTERVRAVTQTTMSLGSVAQSVQNRDVLLVTLTY